MLFCLGLVIKMSIWLYNLRTSGLIVQIEFTLQWMKDLQNWLTKVTRQSNVAELMSAEKQISLLLTHLALLTDFFNEWFRDYSSFDLNQTMDFRQQLVNLLFELQVIRQKRPLDDRFCPNFSLPDQKLNYNENAVSE